MSHGPAGDPPGCRACGSRPLVPVLDLGPQPEANTFAADRAAARDLPRWPLRALVCERCWLLQLDDAGPAEAPSPGPAAWELSDTLRDHARRFVDDALGRLRRPPGSARVIEVASHGNHLAPFLAEQGAHSLIVEGEPALADAAAARGWAVRRQPFGAAAARELLADGGPADLILDNYLLAHVADPDDVAAGLAVLLDLDGQAILELDHVLPLIRDRRFDSIRHGHRSYLGLLSASELLGRHGLAVVDAQPQPIYGGALRLVVRRADAGSSADADGAARVAEVTVAERSGGLQDLAAYRDFAAGVDGVRARVTSFLAACRDRGVRVAGYGAPSRGSTLLNACGVTAAELPFTVDRSPHKQGRFMPGSGIPIMAVEELAVVRPAYVLVLTWDLRDEVLRQLADVRAWGGRFVLPLPRFEIVD